MATLRRNTITGETPVDSAQDTEVPEVEPLEITARKPLLVRLVEKITRIRYDVASGFNAARYDVDLMPRMVVGRDPYRTKVTIRNMGPGTVFLHSSPGGIGYPIPAPANVNTMQTLDLENSGEVWLSASALTDVRILQQYHAEKG